MVLRGTDPESYLTEYTLVYEDYSELFTSRLPSRPARCLNQILGTSPTLQSLLHTRQDLFSLLARTFRLSQLPLALSR